MKYHSIITFFAAVGVLIFVSTLFSHLTVSKSLKNDAAVDVARATYALDTYTTTLNDKKYVFKLNGEAVNLSVDKLTTIGGTMMTGDLTVIGNVEGTTFTGDGFGLTNLNVNVYGLATTNYVNLGDIAISNYTQSVSTNLENQINLGNLAGSNYVDSVSNKLTTVINDINSALYNKITNVSNYVDAVENDLIKEIGDRITGDVAGSNYVDFVSLVFSNKLTDVEDLIDSTSNDLAQAISAEMQNRIAGDITNHNEIVGVQEYAEAVSNKVDSAVYVLATNLNTKVSTNHIGDVTIHGGIVVTDNIYMGAGENLVLTSELDPYWSAVSNAVTQNAVKGSTAFGWGDHSLMGYLTTFVEQDGVALPRVSTLESRTNSWNQAFGWGDHAAIGYLTDELDPYWSSVSNTVTQNAVQGSTAYGWGDHSLVGYLLAEQDLAWTTVSNTVTQNAVQGATAYGWGDHELAGYANTNGSIYVGGNVTATSFIGDGSQLSGVSGGVEFPELIIYSSGATTPIPFTKDYKYYQVVITNTTDVSFDYTGIGDFTGSVLEFQIRIMLVNPADAVTLPADGVAGIKYVGDIDITATIANTVQHLGMLMYSTNNVLLSHWFFDEP